MSQKRIDFIVYDEDFELIAVIELDDPSHDSEKADDVVRDKFLADTGIRMTRFDVRNWPDRQAIQKAVFPQLKVARVTAVAADFQPDPGVLDKSAAIASLKSPAEDV